MTNRLPTVNLTQYLIDPIAARFGKYVDKSGGPDACWPWTASRRRTGYGRFKIGAGITVSSHRLAWALHHLTDPGQLLVCHSCDNPPCCNPAHLWLGTNDENMADMAEKGRAHPPDPVGENNGRAKLTAEQVVFIKAQIRAGHTNKAIAKAFGVTHALISRIRLGLAWGKEPLTDRYSSLKR